MSAPVCVSRGGGARTPPPLSQTHTLTPHALWRKSRTACQPAYAPTSSCCCCCCWDDSNSDVSLLDPAAASCAPDCGSSSRGLNSVSATASLTVGAGGHGGGGDSGQQQLHIRLIGVSTAACADNFCCSTAQHSIAEHSTARQGVCSKCTTTTLLRLLHTSVTHLALRCVQHDSYGMPQPPAVAVWSETPPGKLRRWQLRRRSTCVWRWPARTELQAARPLSPVAAGR
jgi:hypothetical protein